MQAGEGQRENPKQAPHCQHRAQCGDRTHETEFMTSAKTKRRLTDWAIQASLIKKKKKNSLGVVQAITKQTLHACLLPPRKPYTA